jgi:hypothetical protein
MIAPIPGKASRVPHFSGRSLTWIMMLSLLAMGTEAAAQVRTCQFRGAPDALAERPSPLDSVALPMGEPSAKLCYGRPSAHGRTVVGAVDPFGSPWRMGANEPTTLHLPWAASVGTVDVAPGSYSLYAIPEPEAWTIVVNGNTSRWGIPINPEVRRADIGSFIVPTSTLSEPVETLTFRFEGGGASGALVYAWERTTFRIPIARR